MASGTSMAAAYVAGVAACLLSANYTMSPTDVALEITSKALRNVLKEIREFINGSTFTGVIRNSSFFHSLANQHFRCFAPH